MSGPTKKGKCSMNKNNYVWYVCYGSNLCFERFMCYITGQPSREYNVDAGNPCNNTNPPIQSIKIQIPFELYFANSSRRWSGGSVAFIDENMIGETICRAYLITEEQYLHVKKSEGDWYEREVPLPPIDGIPAKTFTNDYRFKSFHPVSDLYRKVIIDGLQEIGLTNEEAIKYFQEKLEKSILYFKKYGRNQ